MGSATILKLLLWKNARIQLRSKAWTIAELTLPTIFAFILVGIRQSVSSSNLITNASYLPFTLDTVPFHPNILAYAPDSGPHREVMERAASLLSACNYSAMKKPNPFPKGAAQRTPFRIQGFPTEEALEAALAASYVAKNTTVIPAPLSLRDSMFLGGVVFLAGSSGAPRWEEARGNAAALTESVPFKVRLAATSRNFFYQGMAQNSTLVRSSALSMEVGWETDQIFPTKQSLGPRGAGLVAGYAGSPGYFWEGFLHVQHAVDAAVIEFLTNETGLMDSVQSLMWRYPYRPYISDDFILVIQSDLPLILMIGYVIAVLNVTRHVTVEKEKKLKEFMKVMGLSNWVHWVAHFVWNLAFLLVPLVLITIVLVVPFGRDRVLRSSDASVVIVFLLLYSVNIVAFCFSVSAFFTAGNSAAGVAGILWFCIYMPYFYIQQQYNELSFSTKMGSCLLINTGMAVGGQIIGEWEGRGVGIQWSNIGSSPSMDDPMTFAHVLAMMVVNSLICFLLTWYVEAVYPGDNGPRQPYSFPFKLSYWLPTRFPEKIPAEDPLSVAEEGEPRDERNFEADPRNLDPVIKIRNLRRVYNMGGKLKAAVDGVNINMYRGHVTALLGHNGAGKTTTMSMLTGLVSPTSGTALIDGLDIRTQLGEVRSLLGLCPQHNVLFDNLTVREHLYLFARLKGLGNVEALRMLDSLRMMDKMSALSSTLSGGMKRKLSVGIALIGGSSVVMLDEPTAGMDPSAARSCWELIQRERLGRSMILTTHHMEEADRLGDRIAIMADGDIRCCGSSLFLKNRYGAGYHLSIVFHPGSLGNVEALTALLQGHVPSVSLDTLAGLQATYILPQSCVHKFEAMFTELEERKEGLGVASFGVSVTTMEEVFLRVGEQASENKAEAEVAPPAADEDDETPIELDYSSVTRNTGRQLWLQQFKALLWKRVLNSIRNYRILVPQLLVPVAMMILTLCINLSFPSAGDSSPLKLDLTPFQHLQDEAPTLFTMTGDTFYSPISTAAPPSTPFYSPLPSTSTAASSTAAPPSTFSPTSTPILSTTQHSATQTPKPPLPLNPALLDVNDATHAAAAYKAQFDASTVNVVSANADLNQKKWYLYRTNTKSFDLDPLGMNSFLNMTQCGVATSVAAMTEPCTGDLDNFNNHDVSSGYFQNGNALEKYLNKLFALSQKDYKKPDKISNKQYLEAKTQIDKLNEGWAGKRVRLSAVALFNNQAFHTPGIALGAVDSALLRLFTGNDKIGFETTNHPTKATANDQIAEFFNEQIESFDVAFAASLSMAFLSATFALLAIRERTTKAKHLQVLFALAVLPMTYVVSFLFPAPSIGFVKIVIYNILLGPGMMAATGIMSIPQLNVGGIRDAITPIFMLMSPHYALGHALRIYHDNYLAIQTCEPVVSSGICSQEQVNNACCDQCKGPTCLTYSHNYFAFGDPGVGLPLFLLFLQTIFYIGVLVLKELGYIDAFMAATKTRRSFAEPATEAVPPIALDMDSTKPPDGVSVTDSVQSLVSSASPRRGLVKQDTISEELEGRRVDEAWSGLIDDPDVSVEQTKVESRPLPDLIDAGAVVVLDHISKSYGDFKAVKNLSLVVEKGECFGLLGINGAGKTTTFKMITGDVSITEGDAYIDGISVRQNPVQAMGRVGYCPQFDAITEQMSVEETLALYGALRGLPTDAIRRLSNQLIASLALTNHRHKLAGTLSGGNKRKLSVAIALLGNPPVVLLDEPTAGVDPIARRRMWKVLSKVREQGLSLILTSHGMEECEALCTRLAIMVDGRFKCLGSPQHLKAKFGTGYTVLLKVSKARKVPKAVQTLLDLFPGTTLKDIHQRLIHIHIASDGVRWAHIFAQMEAVKPQLAIVDYSVAQTSLEQIFLNFSRQQTAEPQD